MGKSLKGKELGKGISQRKDGLFVARKTVNGKQITVTNKSLTELRRLFNEAVDREKKKYTGELTFDEWYHIWFDNVKSMSLKCKLSGHVFKDRYETTYPLIIGGMELKNIRQIDIQSATNKMISSGRGVGIIAGALSTTKQIFKYAMTNGLIQSNPCVDILIDKRDRKRNPSKALEDWVVEAFFSALKKESSIALFKFMLFSGVRIGELAALRWEDIDFENEVIRIRRSVIGHNVNGKMEYEFVEPKSESGIREIPFLGGMKQLLTGWITERESIHQKLIDTTPETYKDEYRDLVFVTPKFGTPYICQNFEVLIRTNRKRMIKREEELAVNENREPRKIQSIHPHLFRHTFATKCFEAGASAIYVQSLMGHSSYNTTVLYTHATEKISNKEILKINRILADF